MKNLIKLFGKIKFIYFENKVKTTLNEDESTVEEYHNPFLGLNGYQDNIEGLLFPKK